MMIEFFSDEGDGSGLPVTLSGIFEDGVCIAIKVVCRSENTAISWAFGNDARAGNSSEGFRNVLQRLYDERLKNYET